MARPLTALTDEELAAIIIATVSMIVSAVGIVAQLLR